MVLDIIYTFFLSKFLSCDMGNVNEEVSLCSYVNKSNQQQMLGL